MPHENSPGLRGLEKGMEWEGGEKVVWIISILAGYCAVKWLVWRITYMALLFWVVDKEQEPPTKEEMTECIHQVVLRSMGLK